VLLVVDRVTDPHSVLADQGPAFSMNVYPDLDDLLLEKTTFKNIF